MSGSLLFSEGRFEIENYQDHCYIYECVSPLRVLLMQKTAPKKYKKVCKKKCHFGWGISKFRILSEGTKEIIMIGYNLRILQQLSSTFLL